MHHRSCCRSCCQAFPWRRSGCAVPHPRVVQGGLPSFVSWKRVLPGPLWEQAEGGEQEKCHSSAILPLPQPRVKLVPAALAEEEDEACTSLQQPQLPTPPIPPSHSSRSRKRMCQQLPLSRGGSSPGRRRNGQVLAPALRSGVQGDPACHRPSPLAPSNSMHGPAQSSPLHIPTSHFSIQNVRT